MSDFANLTNETTWAIAAAAFSNPMYLSAPLGRTNNSQSDGFDVSSASAVQIAFTGTYSGATVAHEQTLDPTGAAGWFTVLGFPNSGSSGTSSGSTSGSTYTFATTGVRHRIKVTALSSGTLEARVLLDNGATSVANSGGGGGGGLMETTSTAAAPTYSEGTDNPVSSDLHGSLRTTVLDLSLIHI